MEKRTIKERFGDPKNFDVVGNILGDKATDPLIKKFVGKIK